jgi:NADPH:quinone reductase-like Zn-dependent oxidoreductase
MRIVSERPAAQALWYVGNGRAEIRPEADLSPASGDVQVRALYGAISRGTERLVFFGRVPKAEYARMRTPFMGGSFPFPVKYGYSTVGRVESGPRELVGRTVFALYPHQDLFTLPADALVPVPDHVPPQRAVLAANMETALNALWDARPAPADRIAVVGAGVLGALVARLCARLPGTQVTLVDIVPGRAELAHALGVDFAPPDGGLEGCDLVFHASASAAGLNTALRLAGLEATVVELSWYGAGEVPVALGGAFHSQRLRLVSSQVGQVATSHRARWDFSRRRAAALALLDDPVLDCLIAPAISFHDLPARLPEILGPTSGALCQLIRYSQ